MTVDKKIATLKTCILDNGHHLIFVVKDHHLNSVVMAEGISLKGYH